MKHDVGRVTMKRLGGGLCLSLALMAAPALAEDTFVRTELQRHDLSGSDTMEVIVSKLEILPGGSIPRHTHFGDEHLIILEGGDLTAGNGKVIPFKAGMTAVFAAGQVHGGLANNGTAPLVAYTVHVVEKGKPLMTLAQ